MKSSGNWDFQPDSPRENWSLLTCSRSKKKPLTSSTRESSMITWNQKENSHLTWLLMKLKSLSVQTRTSETSLRKETWRSSIQTTSNGKIRLNLSISSLESTFKKSFIKSRRRKMMFTHSLKNLVSKILERMAKNHHCLTLSHYPQGTHHSKTSP